jgi:hypothetical protein
MHIPWVLQCRFEELIGDDREGQAARILEYGLERLSGIWDFEVRLAPEGMQILTSAMAEGSRDTAKSPTFRKGKSGGWRDEFTPELIDLFRRLDDGYMERAGYEW